MDNAGNKSWISHIIGGSRGASFLSAPNFDANGRRLIIPERMHKRLFAYVSSSKGEISGLARVEVVGKGGKAGGDLRITEAKIFTQVCTAAHTTLESEALGAFLYKIQKSGEKIQDWWCWWHSHSDFSAFFSSTDEATIRELSARNHLASLCINKKGVMVARYDRRGEGEVLCPIVLPEYATIRKSIRRECKKKVSYSGFNERSHVRQNQTARRGYERIDHRERATNRLHEAIGYHRHDEGVEIFD